MSQNIYISLYILYLRRIATARRQPFPILVRAITRPLYTPEMRQLCREVYHIYTAKTVKISFSNMIQFSFSLCRYIIIMYNCGVPRSNLRVFGNCPTLYIYTRIYISFLYLFVCFITDERTSVSLLFLSAACLYGSGENRIL